MKPVDMEYIKEIITLTNDKDLLMLWECEMNVFDVPKEFNCDSMSSDESRMISNEIFKKGYTIEDFLRHWNVKFNKTMTDDEFTKWWNKRSDKLQGLRR